MIPKDRVPLFPHRMLIALCLLLLLFVWLRGAKAAPCLNIPATLCFEDPVKAANFPNPRGIDVGYINNLSHVDTHVDFVASSPQVDGIRIRYGCGDGTFCDQKTMAMGDNPKDVALADFNNDGFTDVSAPNTPQNRVTIRWGAGDLNPVAHWNTVAGPVRITVADLNNDDLDDFAVVDELSDTITVRLRKAGGGFNPPVPYAGPGIAHTAVTFADCDEHSQYGDLDMFYATSDSQSAALVSVRRNNGFGTFGAAAVVMAAPGDYFPDITLADFNEDDILDILASMRNPDQLAVAFGVGNCTFTNPVFYPAANNPERLYTTDFDQDGHTDFIVGHMNLLVNGKIRIFLGDGLGGFAGPYEPTTVNKGPVKDLGVGDFNEDGKPDIVFTQGDGVYLLESY